MLRSSICMCSLLVVALSLRAEDHPISKKLEAAKAEYSRAVEDQRKELVALLKAKEDAAKKGGDLSGVEKVREEIDKFTTDGTLPKSVEVKSYEAGIKKARAKLEEDYNTAVKEFTQADKIEDAKAVREELSQFRKAEPATGSALGKELLKNPGCEEPAVKGFYPGWKTNLGGWRTRNTNPPPDEGKSYFYAAPVPLAELNQLVSLAPFAKLIESGNAVAHFKGSVRSFRQPNPDSTALIVEYYGIDQKKVLDTYDSGKIQSTDAWKILTDHRTIPKGAAWAKVRLISFRNAGKDNDGYFDNLSLKVTSK